MRQSWETTTSVSTGHIILTPTQQVGSGRPQRESNLGFPHQELSALPTELPRPPKERGERERDRERQRDRQSDRERQSERMGVEGDRETFFPPVKLRLSCSS